MPGPQPYIDYFPDPTTANRLSGVTMGFLGVDPSKGQYQGGGTWSFAPGTMANAYLPGGPGSGSYSSYLTPELNPSAGTAAPAGNPAAAPQGGNAFKAAPAPIAAPASNIDPRYAAVRAAGGFAPATGGTPSAGPAAGMTGTSQSSDPYTPTMSSSNFAMRPALESAFAGARTITPGTPVANGTQPGTKIATYDGSSPGGGGGGTTTQPPPPPTTTTNPVQTQPANPTPQVGVTDPGTNPAARQPNPFGGPATPTGPGAPTTPSNPAARPPGNTPVTTNPGQPGGGNYQVPTGSQSWEHFLGNLFGGNGASNESRGLGVSGLDPRLDAMFSYAAQQAMDRYNSTKGDKFYEGPTVAGLTPDEITAQNMLKGNAAKLQDTSLGGMSYLDTMLQRATNPQDDPTLNAAVATTLKSMDQAATDPGGVFSTIRGNSLASGSFGGTRQGVMEGVAAGRLADAKAKTEAQMRLEGRAQNLNAASAASSNIPNYLNQASAPATMTSAVGNQNRDMNQKVMDDQLMRWGYNSTIGDTRLDQLYQRIGATPLGGYNAQQSFLSPAAIAAGGTSNTQNVLAGLGLSAGVISALHAAGVF